MNTHIVLLTNDYDKVLKNSSTVYFSVPAAVPRPSPFNSAHINGFIFAHKNYYQ